MTPTIYKSTKKLVNQYGADLVGKKLKAMPIKDWSLSGKEVVCNSIVDSLSIEVCYSLKTSNEEGEETEVSSVYKSMPFDYFMVVEGSDEGEPDAPVD